MQAPREGLPIPCKCHRSAGLTQPNGKAQFFEEHMEQCTALAFLGLVTKYSPYTAFIVYNEKELRS